MDCTYKTNRYKMPLLDIVGVTALNTSFHVGFCFVDADRSQFALQNLQGIYTLDDYCR